MIYTLENHELKHAVEEMLFHLLPTETLSRADTAEQITEPYCRSILTEENGEAAARAIVCMDGSVHEAEKRASVTGLATLDYKRTITELVKTTVYDAVVPFLPQAPVWGSLTGVRPAKLARGMIERGMTRGEAAVELREHFHVSPERTALTIRAAATAMEMDKTSVKTIFRCTSVFRSVRRGAITARSYRQPRRSPVNSSSRIWTRCAVRSRRQPRLSAQRASRCRASTSAAAHRPRWTSISWHGCCRRSKITLIFHICANIL